MLTMTIRITKQWLSVDEDKRYVSRNSSVLLKLKMKTWIAKQRRFVNAEDEDRHHRLMDGLLLMLTHLQLQQQALKTSFILLGN